MTSLIVGCGYLGRRVGRLLVARGDRVFGSVRSARSAETVRGWGIEPALADVTEPDSLKGLPPVDRVVYCVGFDRSAGVPMREIYEEGLARFLKSLKKPPMRIVYASSTGVYGQDDGSWVDEESPTEPRHESGTVCLRAEEILRSWSRENSVESVVLRFAGLYGPDRIVRRAPIERGEPIPGDPDRFLNLVHIDDAAEAAVLSLLRAEVGPLFTIADDRPVTRREYYGLVARTIGAPEPVYRVPEPGSPESRRDEANKRVSNRRVRRELGWVPTFPDISSGVPNALGVRVTG